LGDESSASASEVLISSLMENLNSKFFGKKTYGKGTVQELVTLSDGTQYKLTIKKWLTPNGNWINNTNGVVPDKEVELDDKYFETLNEEDNTQRNYTIEYLANKK
jgi:carboxyl-terminal processing protease